MSSIQTGIELQDNFSNVAQGVVESMYNMTAAAYEASQAVPNHQLTRQQSHQHQQTRKSRMKPNPEQNQVKHLNQHSRGKKNLMVKQINQNLMMQSIREIQAIQQRTLQTPIQAL